MKVYCMHLRILVIGCTDSWSFLFILLPCLMPVDFTCERESPALYWVSNIQYI